MNSLINKEQLNELGNAIIAASSSRRMISEDRESFDESIQQFFRTMNVQVAAVKQAYEGLKLEEPFSDEIWQNLCINPRFVRNLYAAKVKGLSETVGISEEFLKPSHPNLEKIDFAISSNMQLLESVFNRPYCRATIYPQHIVNVNGTPRLSDDAYNDHLSHYQFWISNEKEANIKVVVEQFANQYNGFMNFLKASGFGHLIAGVNGTFMDEIFEQQQDYSLKMHPSTPAFLGKLSKGNVVIN
jgi:hypothetical protein